MRNSVKTRLLIGNPVHIERGGELDEQCG